MLRKQYGMLLVHQVLLILFQNLNTCQLRNKFATRLSWNIEIKWFDQSTLKTNLCLYAFSEEFIYDCKINLPSIRSPVA